jgi:hypothetical protein
MSVAHYCLSCDVTDLNDLPVGEMDPILRAWNHPFDDDVRMALQESCARTAAHLRA